jgi:hypothetical protein
MRVTLLFLGALLTASGCSHLILQDHDSAATQAAKVATRIPLGLVTLGLSEMQIHEIKSERACQAEGGWYFMGGCREDSAENRNRAMMLMPAMMNANAQYFNRPVIVPSAPAYKPVQLPPRQTLNCTSQTIGSQTYTTCN